MNIQDEFPLGLTGLKSLQFKGLSRVFSNTTVQEHWCFGTQPSLWSSSHTHTWLLEKNIALTIWTFAGKVISMFFNMWSSFVIAFLPRRKYLLISWLQSPSTVILESKKIILPLCPFFPHLFTVKWWDRMPWSSFLQILSLSQLFHSPLSPPSRSSLVPLCFLPLGWYHLHIWDYWYFSHQSWFQLVIHPVQHFTWCTLYIS